MITLDVDVGLMADDFIMRGRATLREITRVKEDNLFILIIHDEHRDPQGVLREKQYLRSPVLKSCWN